MEGVRAAPIFLYFQCKTIVIQYNSIPESNFVRSALCCLLFDEPKVTISPLLFMNVSPIRDFTLHYSFFFVVIMSYSITFLLMTIPNLLSSFLFSFFPKYMNMKMASSTKLELVWSVGEINYEKNFNMPKNQVSFHTYILAIAYYFLNILF